MEPTILINFEKPITKNIAKKISKGYKTSLNFKDKIWSMAISEKEVSFFDYRLESDAKEFELSSYYINNALEEKYPIEYIKKIVKIGMKLFN